MKISSEEISSIIKAEIEEFKSKLNVREIGTVLTTLICHIESLSHLLMKSFLLQQKQVWSFESE